MRDDLKHMPVNWVDGMKMNKDLFIASDQAHQNALQDAVTYQLSPIQFGVLPLGANGISSFDVKVSVDNQSTVQATVLNCQAVTAGGARINLPGMNAGLQPGADSAPTAIFQLAAAEGEEAYWLFLIVNPYIKQPVGSPDVAENPPRFPYTQPTYELKMVAPGQYKQFARHPYALAVGKVVVNGKNAARDENYIPPCLQISSHPDLIALHGELDQFFSHLENKCSAIVQKVMRKSQQNDLSALVMYLCDRIMVYLGPAITQIRWLMLYEAPAVLLAHAASLARIMKNTIDLRIGTGKDELMNYLSEWCELKQGEFEGLLTGIATLRYDHNDVNQDLIRIVQFVKVTSKLFETLSNLEFIGKRREVGFFVKEEHNQNNQSNNDQKTRRRFFG